MALLFTNDLLGLLTTNYFGNDGSPDFYLSTEPVRGNPVGFKYAKHSPWRHELDRDILHMQAFGIDNKLNEMNAYMLKDINVGMPPRIYTGPKWQGWGAANLEPINLVQLSTIFFLYLVGNMLAFVCFLMEI